MSSEQGTSTSSGTESSADKSQSVESNDEMSTKELATIPGFPSVTGFSQQGIRKLMEATKAFQALPSAGPAWGLHKSYPEFQKGMKRARSTLVPLIASLLRHVKIQPDEFLSGEIEEKFDSLVEANDDMIERIGKAIDVASGAVQAPETIIVNSRPSKAPEKWNKRKVELQRATPKSMTDEYLLSKKARTVIEKPQTKFSTPVDNSAAPFVPKLTEKPNSIKPLSILPEYTSKNEEFFGHPYEVELTRWKPFENMLTKVFPTPFKTLESTPLVFVSTPEQVEVLMRDLYAVSEIALDLEHHSYRSFLGFTCLMQISTRDKDYVIDTIALRDNLFKLNEIFTNPRIVKVCHGANSDIEWLQKDLGLYIVNLFDSHIAAKLLCLPQLSLHYLLQKYCKVSQNKTYQLADWRIRPLPEDMIHYARQDTHYLLYIYDCMKNALIDAGNDAKNMLLSCFEQSKFLCLLRYEKPSNNPQLALRKLRRPLNNRQVYAYKELYQWRDGVAREKDESVHFVLPNHMMLMISEQLPKEMTGILACCDPVPSLVQSNLGIIHKIVKTAREIPLQELPYEEKAEKRRKLEDWVTLINSVHDVTLGEIKKDSSVKKEYHEFLENSEIQDDFDQTLDTLNVWPIPLLKSKDNNIHILQNPTLKINYKITLNNETRESDPNEASAASPFDRYNLSKDIIEMLRDPVKKASLDMENSVVRAVYETVFCEPEESSRQPVNTLSVPDKVFTDDQFVPFNPLANKTESTKKSRKRKRQENEWDDIKPSIPSDLEEGEYLGASDTSDIEGNKKVLSTPDNVIDDKMRSFMSVDANENSTINSNTKKSKKKKKKGNVLKRLRSNFGKIRKDKDSHPSQHNNVDMSQSESPPKKSHPETFRGRGRGNRSKRGNQRKSHSPSNFRGSNKRGRGSSNFRGRNKQGRSITFK